MFPAHLFVPILLGHLDVQGSENQVFANIAKTTFRKKCLKALGAIPIFCCLKTRLKIDGFSEGSRIQRTEAVGGISREVLTV